VKILVDTSFLLLCSERGEDLLSILEDHLGERLEPVLASEVLDELQRLSGRPGRRGRLAVVALEMARRMSRVAETRRAGGGADSALQVLAQQTGFPVLTVDRKLRLTLRAKNLPVITLTKSGRPRVYAQQSQIR